MVTTISDEMGFFLMFGQETRFFSTFFKHLISKASSRFPIFFLHFEGRGKSLIYPFFIKMCPWHVSYLGKPGKIGQIFKRLPCIKQSRAMETLYTLNTYIHYLISDSILSPFGNAKQKSPHLSRRRFWPNLQTATVRKPFMGYGKFLYSKNLYPLLGMSDA